MPRNCREHSQSMSDTRVSSKSYKNHNWIGDGMGIVVKVDVREGLTPCVVSDINKGRSNCADLNVLTR